MTRFPSSLRIRLLLPVLVAVVPTAAMLLHLAQAERGLLVRRTYDEAGRIARTVAAQHQGALDSARGLLLGIARLPSTRALDPACSADVAPLLESTAYVTNVGAMTLDGEVFCSAMPRGVGIDLGDRAYRGDALATGGLVASTYIVSRTAGGPALALALPARDAQGRIVAVAFVSLDARRMIADLAALALPPGTAVAVVDRDRTVLAAYPETEGRPGDPYPQEPLDAAGWGPIVTELDVPGRERRIYAVDPVTLASGAIASRVVVSRSVDEAFAAADRSRTRTLLGFGVVALVAMFAAALAGELLLARRLDALGRAARRIAAGDLSARSGLGGGPDELGAFTQAFDHMAASLERLTGQNRLLLDAIGEGILGLDVEGRVTFVNPAALRMLARTADELRGRVAHDLLHPVRPDGSPFPAADCLVLSVLHDGGRHAGDDTFFRADGSAFPVELVSTPVLDRGQLVGAVIAFKDASERQRLEEQLRQSQKMEAVGQLAGGVAHDFNNLLTAILSFARLAEESLPPGHAARADLGEVIHSAERAAALTRQLLAFSRRQRLAPRVHDLAATVRGMETMLRRLLAETVTLEVDVRAPGTVRADPGQMELVVLNLAVNARDAMSDGGRVRVTVLEATAAELGEGDLPEPLAGGPLSVIEVRDTGIGMDRETLARAFEPFFTTKASGKGTGLGLSTVYGIVTQSGGVVRVRSARGAGTTFRVMFPRELAEPAAPRADGPAAEPRVAPAALEAAPPRLPDVGAAPPRGRTTVLLVEDDEVLRGLARRTLLHAGYEVLDAGRPDAAAALAERDGRIDLLLTDVVLPDESGWELSRRIRRSRRGLKVLFVSGYAGDALGRPVLPPDVPFLAKPFTPDTLLAKVREVLEA